MDAFLATAGTEFDPSFIKLHVGTDDLGELLEFTWDRGDLSPLVDAGLKPLWRNKLYRAILEERATRSNCDAISNFSTGIPTSASLRDHTEVPLSETQDDSSSVSQVSEAPTSQVASLVGVCANVDPEKDSNDLSAAPCSSQTSAGFCSICGEYGHKISECKADSSKDVADFPALGVAGKRRVVPQAQVSVNQLDERERRQAARKEAVEAQERVERDRRNKAAEAQERAVRDRQMQAAQQKTLSSGSSRSTKSPGSSRWS
jgi:hypothetical protein